MQVPTQSVETRTQIILWFGVTAGEGRRVDVGHRFAQRQRGATGEREQVGGEQRNSGVVNPCTFRTGHRNGAIGLRMFCLAACIIYLQPILSANYHARSGIKPPISFSIARRKRSALSPTPASESVDRVAHLL